MMKVTFPTTQRARERDPRMIPIMTIFQMKSMEMRMIKTIKLISMSGPSGNSITGINKFRDRLKEMI